MLLIDFVSIWLDRLFIYCFALFCIIAMIDYVFRKFESHNVYFRALCYYVLSKKIKLKEDKFNMNVGTNWYTKFKGKWLKWEIVEIKDEV